MQVMGHHRKRTVRHTDGVSGGHVEPNIHNIDTNVGIVLIGIRVMRLILWVCIHILYLYRLILLYLEYYSCSYRVAH